MKTQKTVFIIGASGLLGHALARHYAQKQRKVIGCYQHHPMEFTSNNLIPLKINILDKTEMQAALSQYDPHVIIHCAGLTNVDVCETQEELAYQLNGESVRQAAHYANCRSASFVYISTDHLFSGDRSGYQETDTPSPVNVYGKSKLYGEKIALEKYPRSLILRTNFFGRGLSWRHSFTDWIVMNIKNQKPLNVFEDSFFSPIALPHLVSIAEQLIDQKADGIFNTCGSERLSKYEFALRFTRYFGLDEIFIHPSLTKSANLTAKRPSDMSLDTSKLSHFLKRPAPTIQESFDSISHDYKT